jgi:hypothetical protein
MKTLAFFLMFCFGSLAFADDFKDDSRQGIQIVRPLESIAETQPNPNRLSPFFLGRSPTEVSEEFGEWAESKALPQPRAAPVVSNDVLIWQRLREQRCGEAGWWLPC